MRQVELNSTGLKVSAMGIGAMRLSLKGRPPREQAIEVIHRAIDRGVSFFDTADAYCVDEPDKHHNERLLKEALDKYDGEKSSVVIATKGGMMRPEGRWERNGDPDHLRSAIRESHSALGGEEPITLWQHHAPDSDVPLEESLQAVKAAQNEGLIRWVGVSNYSVEQIQRAREIVDVVTVQNQFSPWTRAPDENGVLAYCAEHEITFLPWGPLGGKNRSKELAEYAEIAQLAEKKSASPQQIVLAWLMTRSPCVLPIPGVTRIASLTDSLAAVDVSLTDDEIEQISDAVS